MSDFGAKSERYALKGFLITSFASASVGALSYAAIAVGMEPSHVALANFALFDLAAGVVGGPLGPLAGGIAALAAGASGYTLLGEPGIRAAMAGLLGGTAGLLSMCAVVPAQSDDRQTVKVLGGALVGGLLAAALALSADINLQKQKTDIPETVQNELQQMLPR